MNGWKKIQKMNCWEGLEDRWNHETNGNAVFVSAIEKRNIDTLRKIILEKVRELYRIRYPYKTEFLY